MNEKKALIQASDDHFEKDKGVNGFGGILFGDRDLLLIREALLMQEEPMDLGYPVEHPTPKIALEGFQKLLHITASPTERGLARAAIAALQKQMMAEDQTEKYAGMIEALECDFNLAMDPESGCGLDELQLKIEQGDRRLLFDLALLQELSYGLRHSAVKIIKLPKKGVD